MTSCKGDGFSSQIFVLYTLVGSDDQHPWLSGDEGNSNIRFRAVLKIGLLQKTCIF